jgi:hypothetical protein
MINGFNRPAILPNRRHRRHRPLQGQKADCPFVGTKERQRKHLSSPKRQEDQRCSARSSRAHLPAATAGRIRRRTMRTWKARRKKPSKQGTSSPAYRCYCSSCSPAAPAAGAGRSLNDSSSSTTFCLRRYSSADLIPKAHGILHVLQQGPRPHSIHRRPHHHRERKTSRTWTTN